jgi:glycosyltransferase involved in cell wall biosynthesis
MKKETSKKVALYDPYLDVLGGGEKHILSIVKILDEKGYQPYIFWNKDLTREINQRFLIKFSHQIKWLPINLISSSLKTIKTLKTFDYFFYISDGSYFFSSAKKNYIFAMVPDKKLYQLNLINRIKLHNYRFIVNSEFTGQWLKKWQIQPMIIPSYIDDHFFTGINNKQPIILMVGRFFKQLHSKKQDLAIKLFKKIKQKNQLFKKFKLILAGGLKEEDKDYIKYLKKIVSNDKSIIFKINIKFDELLSLYQQATYLWHLTGLGIDENKNPEKVEHFGIVPLEAAAAGCIVFCHNSGGPKLIFSDSNNGFLINNEKELIEKMVAVERNQKLKKEITKNAQLMVKEKYSYPVFKKQVIDKLDL